MRQWLSSKASVASLNKMIVLQLVRQVLLLIPFVAHDVYTRYITGGPNSESRSGKDLLDHPAFDVGQTEIPPAIPVSQPFMI